MNINKIYILFSVLCLVSCSGEIEKVINEEENSCIHFFADVSNGVDTRVSITNDFKAIFEDNDSVGLFIYKRSEEEESSIDRNSSHASNVKLTYLNGNWELEEPIYYPGSKKVLDIYAYYPYKEDAEVHALEYNADKEMDELLIASAIGVKKSENAIKLKFQHTQSMTHVTLTKESNVPSFDDNMNVYFNGIIGGKYNVATRELAEPITGIIKMDLVSNANENVRHYIAFIPEQEVTSGILFSIFQMTSNKTILSSKDVDHPEIFTRGEVKLFHIRIKQEISKDIVYKLFDLYPAYGIPIGMVVETSNGGKNGKVISLKNIVGVQWAVASAMNIKTNATDINDGITNKMKIQSLENWEDNFPAFNACNEYGERWYLPPIGDMLKFMTNTTSNNNFLNRINENLRHHQVSNSWLDIQLINADQSYFSSTESNNEHNKAVKLYPSNRTTPSDPKDWSYHVRPFYEF